MACRREASSECFDYGDPSAGAFLLCEGRNPEGKLASTILVPSAGLWKVEGRFLQGRDMGSVAIRINRQTLGKAFPLESPTNDVGPFQTLGEISLGTGPAELEILFTTLPSKKPSFFGLDTLRFTRLSTPNANR